MLRSLVGSEMCIRDRLIGLDAIAFPTNAKDLDGKPVTLADFKGKVLLIDCLLYTSDAADDLLCVDLGGRRIIKKKNTKSQTHVQMKPLTNDTSHHASALKSTTNTRSTVIP